MTLNFISILCWSILGGEVTDDILELNKESLTWKEVGKMKTKRGWHKGSAVDLTSQLLSHCTGGQTGEMRGTDC